MASACRWYATKLWGDSNQRYGVVTGCRDLDNYLSTLTLRRKLFSFYGLFFLSPLSL